MGPSQFDVLKYVDQGKVFGKVHSALAHGKCLGVSKLEALPLFHFVDLGRRGSDVVHSFHFATPRNP